MTPLQSEHLQLLLAEGREALVMHLEAHGVPRRVAELRAELLQARADAFVEAVVRETADRLGVDLDIAGDLPVADVALAIRTRQRN